MRIKKVSQTTPTQAQIVDGYSTSATDGYSARYINQAIGAGGETLKLGTILPFSGSTLPTGYLFCDGSAVSRTTYAGLFDVIGTTFGAGDGSTTFNLPNLKGKVPVGLDSNDTDFDTLGETGGEKEHTLTVDEMPSHTHKVRYVGGYANGTAGGQPGTSRDTTPGYNELILAKEGGDQPHNIVQPYLVVNYIIKASETSSVQAQIVDGYSESTTDGYSANYVNQMIESGTDYIKYKDGTMICYGRATISTSINIQYGSAYRTDLLSITLPQTFVDTNYRVFLQPVAPMHVCYIVDADKTTNLFKFYGVGFVNQAASANRQIDYVAIGKWK